MNAKTVLWAGIVVLTLAIGTASAAQVQTPKVPIPPAAEILSRLKKDHPRLLASGQDFERLKQQVVSDPQLTVWRDAIRKQGARILTEAPSTYEIPDGLRLLATSRRILQRIQTLGLLYRLDGDKKYVDRAWLELQAAAAFKDWNPRHFLDTAEMTHAFAIAYDWLYDQWSSEQRATLREAMIEKGIKLANDIQNRNTWWAAARHNWNQVCNGGIGMGALAIGDEAPEVAGPFLQAALNSIQLAMAEFAPDGAWAEGPGYWNYATSYNVVFLAALDTALDTDFGLSQMTGFADAGLFPIYSSGPTGRSFNYADAGDGVIRAPQMFWLARKFNRPAYAWQERQVASPHPLDMIWFDARGAKPTPDTLPLDKYFRNSEVVTLRGDWGGREASYTGFKAGDNKANHSHLDLGTFVLEALGTRWAVDLGSDDYNMPGYFGKQRWDYYRLRTEGHNTLVINPGTDPGQDPAAATKIVRFESKPERSFAIADLTPAYAKQARKVTRGMALLNRRQVLVQDEIQTDKPSEVWWFLHTQCQAKVNADGITATLTQGGNQLLARIVSPQDAKFTLMDAKPLSTSPNPEMQNKNSAVRKLAIRLNQVTDARLVVLLTPLRAGETEPDRMPQTASLANW